MTQSVQEQFTGGINDVVMWVQTLRDTPIRTLLGGAIVALAFMYLIFPLLRKVPGLKSLMPS